MEGLSRDIKILTLNVRGLNRHFGRKKLRLEHLINKYSPDFIFLQETHFSNPRDAKRLSVDLGLNIGHHSIGKLDNRQGVTTLVTSDKWKVLGQTQDNEGRYVTLDVTRNQKYYTLVNIYAPSGSANNDRALFFQNLLLVVTAAKHDIILAGDFNVTLDDRDRNEEGLDHRNQNRNVGRPELQHIINICKLKDTYSDKYRHNQTSDLTYINAETDRGARLDRIYTQTDEDITKHIHIADTLKHNFTDHKGVLVTINSNTTPKTRSPHYKLNDTLLEDASYTQQIEFTIDKYLNTVPDNLDEENETLQVLQAYSLFKKQVKDISIQISTLKKHNMERRLKQLQELLDTHNRNNDQETQETLEWKEELDELLQYKYKGAAIRSRLKLDNEEAPTKAFFSLEHNIQKSRHIAALEDKQNNLQTDNKNILSILEAFYTELFSKETTDPHMQQHFLQYATKLTDEQRDTLETPVTHEELRTSLYTLDTDSTPGPDGLTYKWYRKFFSKLSPFLLRLIKVMLRIEMLEDSQNLSYISLMLKDPENPHLVKNYRPLALNNTDYKIITKSIAIRTARIMHIVINPDQLASVKGRKISQANHLIRDIITYAEDKQQHACILSIDQMKAFDRVDHSWLHLLLEHMNFGEYYRKWIRTIYAAPRACVLANGALSNVFFITRGVRQGDPLSSYLYTMSLEPFLEKIRRDRDIKGITLPGEIERKLVTFADDLNMFLRNYKSIYRAIAISKEYGLASGSKINEPKTKLLALGTFRNLPNDGLNWVLEMRMLGIYYIANKENPGSIRNWQEVENKINKTLALFKYKKASIFGRASVVNTLIFPKLNYLIQSLEIPKNILKRIKIQVRQFLFEGTIRRIKDNTLIQPKLQGGINLQDITIRAITYKIQYLHDIIQNPEHNPIGTYYLALTLRRHGLTWNNNRPHFAALPLPGYFNTLKQTAIDYPQQLATHTNGKLTYRTIVDSNRPAITLKNARAQRAITHDNLDLETSFTNLHQKFITPSQKQITYRILFSITPTTIGQANRTGRIYPCTLCKDEQETEEHIYFTCSKIITSKALLTTMLASRQNNTPANYEENTYRAIFLNQIPTLDKIKHDRQLRITAAYRQTIWYARLESRFNKKNFTQQAIKTRFKYWVDKILE